MPWLLAIPPAVAVLGVLLYEHFKKPAQQSAPYVQQPYAPPPPVQPLTPSQVVVATPPPNKPPVTGLMPNIGGVAVVTHTPAGDAAQKLLSILGPNVTGPVDRGTVVALLTSLVNDPSAGNVSKVMGQLMNSFDGQVNSNSLGNKLRMLMLVGHL